jgi:acetyltransferase-like isoleucine patch superfamily enzyme
VSDAENSPRLEQAGIRDVDYGTNVTIVSPVNLYECRLGNNVFVGPFVEIQSGVEVGDNSKIQSHSFVCELVTIGTGCFIGHGVTFINDRFRGGGPAGGDRSLWESCKVGNNVSIGSNATVLPVSIADGTVIGAGAVVTKDIDVPGTYAGNPARKI